jgi:hypothetical protein
MQTVEASAGSFAAGVQPVQAYAKATTGDYFEIYRELVNGLGAERLAQAHVKVLSAAGRQLIKGNELFDTVGEDEPLPSALQQLREKPEVVLNLIRDTFLSETDIVESAALALKGNTSRFTDFFSAFTFLNDPLLQTTAFSWFQGVRLDSENLSRLGVTGPVLESDAPRGIQFISMMYSFARTPLILYIDQIERLVLDDIERRDANRGYFHSLIEALVANRNVLVVAGVSAAWDQLTLDFIQRLTPPLVIMPSLDVKQAQALIAVWLTKDPESVDVNETFPFTKDGIVEVVKLTRGNVRSIVGLCYNSFELAKPNKMKITPKIVREAAETLEKLYSRATVLTEIEQCLRASKNTFERRGILSEDIVVPGVSSPRLVINVMEPVFLDDEARDALAHAAAAQKLRSQFANIEYVLVDIGYRSSEVEGVLKAPLIDFYVRYDPERFKGEFNGIIQTIHDPIESSAVEHRASNVDKINETIEQLQALVITRGDQQTKLEKEIAKVLQAVGSPVINVESNVGHGTLSRLLDSVGGRLAISGLGLVILGSIVGWLWFQQAQINSRERSDQLTFELQKEQLARQFNQDRNSAVSRSLDYIDRLNTGKIADARDSLDASIKQLQPYDFNLGDGTGGSLFNLLLSAKPSALPDNGSAVRQLLDFYGSVTACMSGNLCDKSTICDAFVPQIASLEASIARAARLTAVGIGRPAANPETWTQADRLLQKCASG